MKTPFLFALLAIGAASPAFAGDVAVTQQNQSFSSNALSVHVGDKLTFNNSDDVTHNITIKGGPENDADDLGLQKPGKSVSYTFDAKGSYRVICSIHPKMKMTVTVQ